MYKQQCFNQCARCIPTVCAVVVRHCRRTSRTCRTMRFKYMNHCLVCEFQISNSPHGALIAHSRLHAIIIFTHNSLILLFVVVASSSYPCFCFGVISTASLFNSLLDCSLIAAFMFIMSISSFILFAFLPLFFLSSSLYSVLFNDELNVPIAIYSHTQILWRERRCAKSKFNKLLCGVCAKHDLRDLHQQLK